MGKITKQDVEHVAKLARLEIAEEDTEKFSQQLSSVLDYFGRLDEVQTGEVETTQQISGLKNIAAVDELGEVWNREELLANAPEQEGGFIKVKAVFDGSK